MNSVGVCLWFDNQAQEAADFYFLVMRAAPFEALERAGRRNLMEGW